MSDAEGAAASAATSEGSNAETAESESPQGQIESGDVEGQGEGSEASPQGGESKRTVRDLSQAIKARQEDARAKKYERELVEERARFKAEQESWKREMESLRQRQEELNRYERAKYKAQLSPSEALRELGLDPMQMTELLSKEALGDDPVRRWAQERDETWKKTHESTVKTIEELRAEVAALKEARSRDEQQYHETVKAQRNRAFLQEAQAYKSVTAIWEPEEVLERAYKLVEYHRKEDPNFSCTNEEILVALEKQASGRLARLRGEGASAKTEEAQKGNGAKGSRALTSGAASERRASPKPPSEMTEEEKDQAMIAAAREAKAKRVSQKLAS